jgi:hypothetical protein
MWGYVSSYSSLSGKAVEIMTSQEMLKEIQRQVFLNNVLYLKESTALGELPAWVFTT